MKEARIVGVGECMLELSNAASSDQIWRLHSGGDTYNSLVYLARLGFDVRYLTALGKDRFSERMREEWAAEGVSLDLVLTHPTRHPGAYAINLDAENERSFTYWRSESAAKALMECPNVQPAFLSASKADFLYVTGISLSILDDAGRLALGNLASQVRANGGEVAFDINYRANGWGDRRSALNAIEAFAKHVSIALPSAEDQAALYGDRTAAEAIRRWRMSGAKEVVIKSSQQGAVVGTDEANTDVPPERTIVPRDTTGAGDAFNGGYIAARISGMAPIEAAKIGNKLAGAVIQHPGAVIPKVMMPIGMPRGSR